MDDLKAYVRNVFARDTLTVAVVGDIDADAAGKLIDRVFGGLPEKADACAGCPPPRCRALASASWSISTCRRP